jgi:hypothetical protein
MTQLSKTFEFYNQYSTNNAHTTQAIIQMPQMVNSRTPPPVLTFFSNKLPGSAYYKLGERIHTVTYTIEGSFRGTCSIQVSNSPSPIDQDWETLTATQKQYLGLETTGAPGISGFGGAISHPTQTDMFNFTGDYAWIRVQLDISRGTLQAAKLNF